MTVSTRSLMTTASTLTTAPPLQSTKKAPGLMPPRRPRLRTPSSSTARSSNVARCPDGMHPSGCSALVGRGFLRFNRRVSRVIHALAGLVAVFRNRNIRRLELAWGAAITAEWAHFVALGVFAYDQGGTAAVGIAGLVRLLPAALVAPFAASFGDR